MNQPKRHKRHQPPPALPSYEDLAKLVVSLTEINIANIDSRQYQFLHTFTYDDVPPHWLQALAYRAALKVNKVL